MARLGINIEEVAGLREIRGAADPDPVTAAVYAEVGGCDGIVVPLRPDLKPVTERDARLLREMVKSHLTFLVPPVEKLITAALSLSPDMITLIPGKKAGTTPGGGLDVMGHAGDMARLVHDIREREIVSSLLIEPQVHQVKAAAKVGFDYVEFHMGSYTLADDLNERADQLSNIGSLALAASKMGLGVSAGCGLNYQNVQDIAALAHIEEINIGHAVMARALWIGMEAAVRDMAALVH